VEESMKPEYKFFADKNGYEGLADFVSTIMLKNSNIHRHITYSLYTGGINRKSVGCCAESVSVQKGNVIMLDQILTQCGRKNLFSYVTRNRKSLLQIKEVTDAAEATVGCKCGRDLAQNVFAHAVLMDNKAVYYDLGFIKTAANYRVLPSCGHGNSLLSDCKLYPIGSGYMKAFREYFNSNIQLLAVILKELGYEKLKLNYLAFMEELEKNMDTMHLHYSKAVVERMCDVLVNRLDLTRNYFWEEMRGNIENVKKRV
jgi:hypothetical protein